MNKTSLTCIAVSLFMFTQGALAQDSLTANIPGPSFKDIFSLKLASSPVLSPNNQDLIYTIQETDWENNRYDRELWLSRPGRAALQLTRTADGNSFAASWSPDGSWIAFMADRGSKTQVYLMASDGGEAFPITDAEEGVRGYEWSPDGKHLALHISEPESEEEKSEKELFGEFDVDDEMFRLSHLWIQAISFDSIPTPRRLTGPDGFTVGNFKWSPDGTTIAFHHTENSLITSFSQTDLSLVDVATGDVSALVVREGYDGIPRWSPDGSRLAFFTSEGDSAYYLNDEIAILDLESREISVLTTNFDENVSLIEWTDNGLYFIATQRTNRHLFHLNPASGDHTRVLEEADLVWSVDISTDGEHIAYLAESASTIQELYLKHGDAAAEKRTNMSEQVAGWALGTREVIQWESEDGAEIEGVLWLPQDYDSQRAYPLLVQIHGGPAGTSYPRLATQYVYPLLQWINKGALVLQPNYRGSNGYGEAFRALNVRNLGVGDAWDVESGVKHLIDTGRVDPDSVGAMGWSQGGYISAFLATTSELFKGISVGAGISNWMTYYVNTDIHPFTRHYLKATPWEDPDIYAQTSPMTYITQAKTPTLIQHGEFDRRVPIPNAYELLQGLRDVGVPSRLVVYKGFGHGISKPKEALAATWHNWIWFSKHLWGEDVTLPITNKD